jgi:hypothetical protein
MDKELLYKLVDDDAEATKIGDALAELLNLKRDPEHKDRWVTSWGSKFSCGLARSVVATIVRAAK